MRMHERIDVMGVPVDFLDVDGAARAIRRIVSEARAEGSAEARAEKGADEGAEGGAEKGAGAARAKEAAGAAVVCTPNAEIMMAAHKDAELNAILRGADLVLADGAGVALAARILGKGRIPRAQGFDTAHRLLESGGLAFYFLGGKPGVAQTAAEAAVKRYPLSRVAGFRDGYFTQGEEHAVICDVNHSGADVLLAALGAPKQEKWMWRNRAKLDVAVCIGVGGTLDVLAGAAQLAPASFRRHGFEWLYRLLLQPKRVIRMLRLPQYILLAIRWRLLGPPSANG